MQVIEKNINNVINGVATIMLYDQIGDSYNEDGSVNYGVSGNSIANQIQYLNEVEKVERINIRINSIGGNVYEGYSIVSAMLSSKCEVHTYIDGLAASISGVIALCGKTCSMFDYGTLMLHNPFGKGVNDDVLSYIKGTLVKIISNRSKRTQEEIAFMMDGETWLNATDALKMGFVDDIISSAKPIKIDESNRRNLYNLVTIYNKVINENKTTTPIKMEKTENEIALEAKVKEANDALIAATTENETLTAKLKTFEDAQVAELETKAVELVENAIKDGKVKAESKEHFVEMAKLSFDVVKNSLDAMIVSKVAQAAKILDAAKIADTKDGREGWNIRTWEKKAPKELANMYKENREEYDRLYNEYYKKGK